MQERGRVDYIQQDEEDFKVSATRHLVYAAHNRLTARCSLRRDAPLRQTAEVAVVDALSEPLLD